MSRLVPISSTTIAALINTPTIGSASGKPSQMPITPSTTARR